MKLLNFSIIDTTNCHDRISQQSIYLVIILRLFVLWIIALLQIRFICNGLICFTQKFFHQGQFVLGIKSTQLQRLLFVNEFNQLKTLRAVLLLTNAFMLQLLNISFINELISYFISQKFLQRYHGKAFTLQEIYSSKLDVLNFRIFIAIRILMTNFYILLSLKFIIYLARLIRFYILCLLLRLQLNLLLFLVKSIVLKRFFNIIEGVLSQWGQIFQVKFLDLRNYFIEKQDCLLHIQFDFILNSLLFFLQFVFKHHFLLFFSLILSFIIDTLRIFVPELVLKVDYRQFLGASLLLFHKFDLIYKVNQDFMDVYKYSLSKATFNNFCVI